MSSVSGIEVQWNELMCVTFCLSDRPAYVAFGLSSDAKMGEDSVIECVPEQGTVNAYASWTTVGPYGSTRLGVVRIKANLHCC